MSRTLPSSGHSLLTNRRQNNERLLSGMLYCLKCADWVTTRCSGKTATWKTDMIWHDFHDRLGIKRSRTFPISGLSLLTPPKGGRGYLMSPPCLESQGCHLIPLCYLLSCSSALSCYPFCLIVFCLLDLSSKLFPENSSIFFVKR